MIIYYIFGSYTISIIVTGGGGVNPKDILWDP
jgi:hypothetical protein